MLRTDDSPCGTVVKDKGCQGCSHAMKGAELPKQKSCYLFYFLPWGCCHLAAGPAIPGTELKIVDPRTKEDLPDGERGLIMARGRSHFVLRSSLC